MTTTSRTSPDARPEAGPISDSISDPGSVVSSQQVRVTVEELRQAWHAIRDGQFRATRPRPQQRPDPPVRRDRGGAGSPGSTGWQSATGEVWDAAPGERVVAVWGSAGSTGATTVALALGQAATQLATATMPRAEPADAPFGAAFWARVVECCPASASGLAAASTTEHGRVRSSRSTDHPTGSTPATPGAEETCGPHGDQRDSWNGDPDDAPDRRAGGQPRTAAGWLRGTRDGLVLDRVDGHPVTPGNVPAPACWPVPEPASPLTAPPTSGDAQWSRLTILDLGWPPSLVDATPGWLPQAARAAQATVVVAAGTIPGLRRLEATLDQPVLRQATVEGLIWLAITVQARRLPAWLARSAGPQTARLLNAGRVLVIPRDRRLAVAGLDSRPLPAPITAAMRPLLASLTSLASGDALDAESGPDPRRLPERRPHPAGTRYSRSRS